MPIRVYESKEPLPSKGPYIPPVEGVSVADVFQIASAATSNAARILEKIEAARSEVELMKAQAATEQWYDDFQTRVETMPPEEWKRTFEKEKNQLRDSVLKGIKSKRVREMYSFSFDTAANRYANALQSKLNMKLIERAKADTVENLTYWAEKLDMEKVGEILSSERTAALFDPKDLMKIASDARGIAAKRLIERYSMGLELGDANAFLNDRAKVNELLERNGLQPQDIDDATVKNILQDIVTKRNIDESVRRERQRLDFEEANEKLWDMFRKAPESITSDVLDSLPIDVQGAGGKIWWRDYIAAYFSRMASLRGKEDDFPTDKQREADLLRMLYDPNVDRKTVLEYFHKIAYGNGLSNDDTRLYWKEIDQRFTDIVLNESLAAIRTLVDTAVKEAKQKYKAEFLSHGVQLMREFSEWYRKNQTATPGQMKQKLDSLTLPFKRNWDRHVLRDLAGLELEEERTPEKVLGTAGAKSEYEKRFGPTIGIERLARDTETNTTYTVFSPDNERTWYRLMGGELQKVSAETKGKWVKVK